MLADLFTLKIRTAAAISRAPPFAIEPLQALDSEYALIIYQRESYWQWCPECAPRHSEVSSDQDHRPHFFTFGGLTNKKCQYSSPSTLRLSWPFTNPNPNFR